MKLNPEVTEALLGKELAALMAQAESLEQLLPADSPAQAKETVERLVLEAYELGVREATENIMRPRREPSELDFSDDGRRLI